MSHAAHGKKSRKPGSIDTLHTGLQFQSDNEFEIPCLLPFNKSIPSNIRLLAYNARDDSGRKLQKSIAHFFLDDYRFESVWLRPQTGLTRVRRFWGALTPDFSLYTDWPIAAQIYNTYRNRLIGALWQREGINVIPTVNWSIKESFAFCFAGIPTGSTVAISVPALRSVQTHRLFCDGFNAMEDTLEPSHILCYGKLPFNCESVICYPPDWLKLRALK